MAHTTAHHTLPSLSGAMPMRRAVRGQATGPRGERRDSQRFTPLGMVSVKLGFTNLTSDNSDPEWVQSDLLDISTGGACVLLDLGNGGLSLLVLQHQEPESLALAPGTPLKVKLQTASSNSSERAEPHNLLTKNALVCWCHCHSAGLCTLGLRFNESLNQLPAMQLAETLPTTQ